MAQFNLDTYETVDERLARLHKDERFADVRIITINHTSPSDRATGMWVVECRIYLNRADQLDDLPIATGWAFEIDGAGMANKTSALENCETSSRGRALQALALSGSRQGPSREEMEKVARGVTPTAIGQDELYAIWKQVTAATTVDQLKAIWDANTGVAQVEFQDDFGPNTLAKAIAFKKAQLTKPADLEVQTKLAKPATKAVGK